MDVQFDLDQTLMLAAYVQASVARASTRSRRGHLPTAHHRQLVSENKWAAARYGLDALLMDLAGDPRTRLPASELARRSVERLAPYARELGCADALAEIERTISWGNGATRMMRAYNANRDMTELMRELAHATELRSGEPLHALRLADDHRRLLAGGGALEDRLLERARTAAVADRRARRCRARRARCTSVVDRARGRAPCTSVRTPAGSGSVACVQSERSAGAAGRLGELAVMQDRDAEPLEPRQVEDPLVLVHGLAHEQAPPPPARREARLRQRLGRVESRPAAAPVGHEHRPGDASGARSRPRRRSPRHPAAGAAAGCARVRRSPRSRDRLRPRAREPPG